MNFRAAADGHGSGSAALGLEHELPMKWLVKGRRGRAATATEAFAVSAAPAAVLQDQPTRSRGEEEEKAAMILLGMSSGGTTLAGHQMSGLEQLGLLADHVADSAAMDLDPETEVEVHMMVPELAAGAGAEQQQAEKPAPEVDQVLPVLEEPVAAMATTAPEVKKPAVLKPARDDALAVIRAAKKPKMQRLDDLMRTPPNPTPAAAAAADQVEPQLMRMPPPAPGRRYVCPACDISFPTHYALGGHSKGHKNVSRFSREEILQGRFSAAHAFGSIMAAQRYQRQGQGGGAVVLGGIRYTPPLLLPAARDPTRRPCPRCSLDFSSGQALGGHMRMHLREDRERMKVAASVAAASASAARPIVPRLDFDLNKSPME